MSKNISFFQKHHQKKEEIIEKYKELIGEDYDLKQEEENKN